MRLLISCFLALSFFGVQAQDELQLVEASITDLQAAMASGELTSAELVDRYLARIEAYDRQGPALNAIIRINPLARERAVALDRERRAGQLRGPLHGIPILVKDNYNTDFMPTTGASVALADFVPSQNATQIDRLLEAGAIVLAKTNLHEFAYGITTVSSLTGQTRNPYDIRRVPGGSSGGTAAAVAASFGSIGLGSDTCGSIRIPAAFNNLIGLRPSKGLSSIFGVMPLSHTQDVAGPLARSAEDLAIVLDAVSGFDPEDDATALMQNRELPRFREALGSTDLSSLRLGRLGSLMESADSATRERIDEALAWFEAQGAEIVEVEIANASELISRSGLIGHEFRIDLNQYLARFLSAEVITLSDIVDGGLYHEAVRGPLGRSRASVANPDAYAEAVAARAELRAAIESMLAEQDLDAIVYPPVADQPVRIGESQPGNNCSLSANSGLPALSMPVGFSSAGLPVGMELLGSLLSDVRLLAIGHAWEQANSPRRVPAVTPPLEDGEAPEPDVFSLTFDREGVSFSARFERDRLRNELRYGIDVGESSAPVYAVTLLVDGEEGYELNEFAVANLLGPQTRQREGSYFMSPTFREAFEENRVYLRVFGEGLDAQGVWQALR